MIIPGAAVGAGLVDLALAFLIQIGLMIYYGIAVSSRILMVPVLVLLTTLLAAGVGMWLSALNVKYRDIRYAIPFVIQLWMFASPVIYPASMAQGKLKYVLMANPLTGIIENFRIALFGHSNFHWRSLGISAAITLFILVYSAYSFRRMERSFADIV
jgi:lipopolysaccharide transport system permease protein